MEKRNNVGKEGERETERWKNGVEEKGKSVLKKEPSREREK